MTYADRIRPRLNHDQTLALQQDALKKADCDQIYTDTASGASQERPGLAQAVSHRREGDTLVVWRLDRLGRSLQHLIQTVTALDERGIGFRSITENIDRTTSGGKLVFHIFGLYACVTSLIPACATKRSSFHGPCFPGP